MVRMGWSRKKIRLKLEKIGILPVQSVKLSNRRARVKRDVAAVIREDRIDVSELSQKRAWLQYLGKLAFLWQRALEDRNWTLALKISESEAKGYGVIIEGLIAIAGGTHISKGDEDRIAGTRKKQESLWGEVESGSARLN